MKALSSLSLKVRFFGAALALSVALGSMSGCKPDPVVTIDYAPYTGSAFPNRAKPIAWPSGGAAIVTNNFSDTVDLVDAVTGQQFFSRPVGRNPVDLDGPHHIAVDTGRRVAFTALSYPRIAATGPHAAHGSASIPGYVQKLSLDDLSIVGNVRVENNPGDIVLSDDKKRLVVSHFDLERATKNPTDVDAARADLAIIDPDQVLLAQSGKPTYINICVAPHGVALSRPDAKTAWVACYGEDAIAVVNLDDPTAPVVRVPVGPGVSGFGMPAFGPYAAVLTPDQKTVILADTESDDLRFFDVASQTIDDAKTIKTQGAPYVPKVSDDGKTLWVPTQQPDGIYAFDLTGANAPLVKTFTASECVLPHVVERVGDKLFVVCEGDHKTNGNVVTLDDSLSIIATSDVGVYADSFGVVARGFQ